jgi:hypothetical protein
MSAPERFRREQKLSLLIAKKDVNMRFMLWDKYVVYIGKVTGEVCIV